MATHHSDGDFTDATPTGADVRHMPFLNIGNQYNYMIERFITQNIASKAVVPLGTAATADDGGNSDTGDSLYLINESPLDQGLAAVGQARYSRLWAPEWADITVYDGLSFPLPDFRGLTYPGITFNYIESFRRLNIIQQSADANTIVHDLLDGTFTYTDPDGGGTTAALSTTASAGTLLTALQAVDPNVTQVTQREYGIEIERTYVTATENPAVAGDIVFTGVSGDPQIHIVTLTGQGVGQAYSEDTIDLYRGTMNVNLDNHGFNSNDITCVNTLGSYQSIVTVVDANNFNVARTTASLAISYDVDKFYRLLYWYTRAKQVRSRFIFKFYIPGVTPGITTPADIPEPVLIDHDFALLEAVAVNTAEITIGATKPVIIFPGVYQVRLTNVSVADLYDNS